MIPVLSLENQDVGVFGLARSGTSTVRALVAGGARVFAWDDNERNRLTCAEAGAQVKPFSGWPWSRLASLVLSPGVPLTHPVPHEVVQLARKSDVEIIGDMELFARELPTYKPTPRLPLIAITGTNGKSTTTAVIGHILSSCGYRTEVGGNIGRPVLDLGPPMPRTAYVLEVSSYQIDLSPSLTPGVAVLTNITPDHLDRHGSMENYAAVKARLLQQAGAEGTVCVGVDDPHSAAIHSRFAAAERPHAIPVSVGKVLGRGVFVLEGVLYDAQSSQAAKVMDLRSAKHLPGAHNWQNAALAYAATRGLVGNSQAVASAIESFPGLPHRMEDVGCIGKVRFINDSKATNADAAERALRCFKDVYWIAGGIAKEGGIEQLRPRLGDVRKTYLIGEAAEAFAHTLDGLDYQICHTLDMAVAAAAQDAQSSDAAAPVVLLSPACASFDQFKDYEQRGGRFRVLVGGLSSLPLREAS